MGAILIVSICLFFTIIFGSYYVQMRMRERSKTDAERRLEEIMLLQKERGTTKLTKEEEAALKEAESKLLPSLGPLDNVADWVRRRFIKDADDGLVHWLDMQLMYAGLSAKGNSKNNLTAQDVIAYVLVFWSAVLAVMLLLTFVVGFPKILSTILLILFMSYPYIRLRQTVSARKERVFFELPAFMDDLIANLASGAVVIDEALYSVVETNMNLPTRRRKILPEEFGQAYAEYRYANRSRNEALRDVAYRLGVPAVDEFVDLLVQGLDTGYPIRDLLVKQSKQVHELWKQEMRTFIGKKESAFVISVGFICIGVLLLFMTPLIVNIANSAGQAQ